MAKNNVFSKLPAQLLLQDRSVAFSGYLERKVKVLSFKPWLRSYVVIAGGNLYVYQTSTSARPSLVCVMSAFDHIQVFKGRLQPPLWVFSLKPMIRSVPELKFAAPSEREMDSWICEMRMGIVISKNQQLQRSISQVSREDVDEEMEGSIYSTVAERNKVRNVLLSGNQNNIYEEPDDMDFQQNISNPSAPPLVQCYPSLNSFDKDSLFSEIEENVEYYLFYGSREDAVKELSRYQFLGSYLVRKESDRQILTVRCETNFVKYCLICNKKCDRISISGQSDYFENLDHLLSYYHEHNLPNQNCKLLLPYKLINNNFA